MKKFSVLLITFNSSNSQVCKSTSSINVKWFCNLWGKVVHANTYTTTGITGTSELEDEQKGQVQVSKEHSELKFAKKS